MAIKLRFEGLVGVSRQENQHVQKPRGQRKPDKSKFRFIRAVNGRMAREEDGGRLVSKSHVVSYA